MIERALWVTTNRFEAKEPGPDFINPICFGKDFALWLLQHLKERGLKVSEPIQEDWGWAILVVYADLTFTISIGVSNDSIGQVPANWRIGVAYEKPLNPFRTWLKPAPIGSLEAVFQHVQDVLLSEAGFRVSEREP